MKLDETTETASAPVPPLAVRVRDYIEQSWLVKPIVDATAKVLYANDVSMVRFPITLATIALHQVSPEASLGLHIANTAVDGLDGAVARSAGGQETAEGAIIDPLVDKMNAISFFLYFALQHPNDPVLLTSMAACAGLDTVSQAMRGVRSQVEAVIASLFDPDACHPAVKSLQAAFAGKVKQTLQCIATGGMLLYGEEEWMRISASIALAIASVFCVAGMLQRQKAKEKEKGAEMP